MLPFTSVKSVLCIFRVYRIISRIFSPNGIRAPYQQRHSSYSAFSAIIGKKFPFVMGCSGFTVLSNTGHLLFQAPGSSGVLDGISSTRSAPHIVLELSVTDFQFKAFFLFCHYFKLDPIPATLDTVCLYVQFLSRTLTPASIRNYLNGVKLLH